ncbi:PREDICTED: WUSCHEL-related homeobox 9-like [Lupinus angustifolius]|uniref:WUSCHEL-related homeobox 9-like n=1 Tax=Lupinus angustifolius TaxID=3871 RepID=UPI00092ECE00|nr:PREDICTED: WUSCHEL-related homeobox 9-like [Lupinus angustifolius]
MASSNKHWPSMFKSKPYNQWQHDINSSILSNGCHRSNYNNSGSGCDERSPEPKPRWNPKPEQIRILEAIFNSGMVNPPRDEIRKIRMQLQEYGQVGDANVFYWFQNRKSRSKNKLRNLQNSKNQTQQQSPPPPPQNNISISQVTAPSSSSSSSSPKNQILPTKGFSIGFSNTNEIGVPNSPPPSVNQTYFQTFNDTNLLPQQPSSQPFFFPLHQNGQGIVDNANNNAIPTQGLCFSDPSNVVQAQPHHPQLHGQHQNVGPCNSMLLNEIRNYDTTLKKDQYQDKGMKIMHQLPQQSFSLITPTPNSLTSNVAPPITNTSVTVSSNIAQLQGVGGAASTAKSMVFINDVAFEVPVGPFNVREAFGVEAVLLYSSGHSVPTDDWGVTLHPLQHGGSYYLLI